MLPETQEYLEEFYRPWNRLFFEQIVRHDLKVVGDFSHWVGFEVLREMAD